MGLTGLIDVCVKVAGHVEGHGGEGVGADGAGGGGAHFRQGVGYGYRFVGHGKHGQVVEVVAVDYQAVGSDHPFEPEHGGGFGDAGAEYLYI